MYRFKEGGPFGPPQKKNNSGRVLDAVKRDLEREREKLNRMHLGDPGILEQSRVVDRLVTEYQRVLVGK